MTLERTMLQRDLVAIRGWIENVKTTIDETDDPEERADCMVLLNLYSRKEEFIESKINLPFLAEEARQRRAVPCLAPGFHADNPWTEEEKQLYCLADGRLEEAELKLACAERSIEDWNRLLPEWQDTYKLIKKRIDERAGGGVTADAPDPQTEHAEPDYTSPLKKAIRQALMIDRTLSNQEIRQWIDENALSEEVCGDFKTKENPRGSLESAHKNSEFRARIEQAISKVRSKMRIQLQ
jgi:hypothetical protein